MNVDKIFGTFPELNTASLVLTQIDKNDAGDIYNIYCDEETMRYYGFESARNIDEVLGDIREFNREYEKRLSIIWGIKLTGSNETIGLCGFYNISKRYPKAEIFYILSRKYWKHGIMTEALGKVIEFGFKRMLLESIEATVHPKNLPSIRLLVKYGFSIEGIYSEQKLSWYRFEDFIKYVLHKSK